MKQKSKKIILFCDNCKSIYSPLISFEGELVIVGDGKLETDCPVCGYKQSSKSTDVRVVFESVLEEILSLPDAGRALHKLQINLTALSEKTVTINDIADAIADVSGTPDKGAMIKTLNEWGFSPGSILVIILTIVGFTMQSKPPMINNTYNTTQIINLVDQHVAAGSYVQLNQQNQLCLGNRQDVAQGIIARPKTETVRRAEPKVGRNELCPCASGKKYKRCHGK
jgi:SEC-C motif